MSRTNEDVLADLGAKTIAEVVIGGATTGDYQDHCAWHRDRPEHEIRLGREESTNLLSAGAEWQSRFHAESQSMLLKPRILLLNETDDPLSYSMTSVPVEDSDEQRAKAQQWSLHHERTPVT